MKQAMSLRLRITLFLVAAVVLTLGTATKVIDWRVDTEVAQRADANLLERAQALSDIYRVQHLGNAAAFPSGRMPEFLADDGRVYFYIDCHGSRVASSVGASALPWPASSAGQPVYTNMTAPQDTELRAVVFRFSPESDFTREVDKGVDSAPGHTQARYAPACSLGLAVDHSEVEQFQGAMDVIFIGCILLAIAVVAILTPLLVTRGLKPVAHLAEAMRGIGPDAPGRRLGETNVPELQPLIARFNEVLARMEQGLTRERQFASGVAHELRTPLAELRTLIEVELRYPSGRDSHVLFAEIGTIGMEMERVVGALLLLTRIEAGIEQVQRQSVDIAAITRKLLERYRGEMETRNLELDAGIDDGVAWAADGALLEVLFGNLLGNAVAYAPVGTRISLRCRAEAWWVNNDAPELAVADVALMGQRFWRKGKDAGVHSGLGLALAAAAARAQSVHLSLDLREGRFRAKVALREESDDAVSSTPVDRS
jgi:two-component system, OmpR family, sensor histidine kinase QseC